MNTQTDSCISETHRFLRYSKVVERLLSSELYQDYQEIFQATTGLPLELHSSADEEVTACRGSVNQNRFCHLLNGGDSGCGQCLMAQRCLVASENRGVQSIACFAGLQETAVPIMVGSVMVAQLKTGQIFHEKPSADGFAEVAGMVENSDTGLEEAYLATPVIEKQKYQAMVTLLAAFSLQLTKLAKQIDSEQEDGMEDVVEMAMDYIEENLTECFHLEEVAAHLKISSFHLCRKFKEVTGVTMTTYVTDRRVGLVKEALMTTERRITDIAFDAGFQSLSQFNRSFHRFTGVSPTNFRSGLAA